MKQIFVVMILTASMMAQAAPSTAGAVTVTSTDLTAINAATTALQSAAQAYGTAVQAALNDPKIVALKMAQNIAQEKYKAALATSAANSGVSEQDHSYSPQNKAWIVGRQGQTTQR